MVGRGEHKAHADLLGAEDHLFGRQVQVDAGRFQQVGTAAFAGNSPVAVLGDGAAGGGDHKGAGGGDVEQVGAIAAGAAGVHQIGRVDGDWRNQFAHGGGSAGNLVDALALHAQADQEGADLGVRGLTGHDEVHGLGHLLRCQVQVLDNAGNGGFHIHGRILI